MSNCQDWYKILRLKKVEVVAQLTARQIAFQISQHHMTLKSKLYKSIKEFVQDLMSQFNEAIGNDWTEAYKASKKTLKNFKKDLLKRFHPDVNQGSTVATEICQIINGWTEPLDFEVEGFIDWESENERAEAFVKMWNKVKNSPESPECVAERELQQKAVNLTSVYEKYNRPSKRTSNVTKFYRLSKKAQRDLIEQYGDIFHTEVADVPFGHVMFLARDRRITKFFYNMIVNGDSYAHASHKQETAWFEELF